MYPVSQMLLELAETPYCASPFRLSLYHTDTREYGKFSFVLFHNLVFYWGISDSAFTCTYYFLRLSLMALICFLRAAITKFKYNLLSMLGF